MQNDVLANLAYAEGTEGTPGGGVVTGARLEPAWWVQKNMEAVSNDDIDIEHRKGQYGTIYGRQSRDVNVNCRRAYSLSSEFTTL